MATPFRVNVFHFNNCLFIILLIEINKTYLNNKLIQLYKYMYFHFTCIYIYLLITLEEYKHYYL